GPPGAASALELQHRQIGPLVDVLPRTKRQCRGIAGEVLQLDRVTSSAQTGEIEHRLPPEVIVLGYTEESVGNRARTDAVHDGPQREVAATPTGRDDHRNSRVHLHD